MKTSTFENFPWWMVLVCSAHGLAIYAIGAYLVSGLGLLWLLIYLGYCLVLEIRLLRGSCRYCYYYGKRCGFGKGRLCARIFRQAPRPSGAKQITWWHVVPDFLVSLVPLAVGIGLQFRAFTWTGLLSVCALILLASIGAGFVRGQLACKFCAQRELGCPAERLFAKSSAAQT
jgi:hypothetical protein